MQLPPPQPYHPITFLERGVAVPFTTQALVGSRARPAPRGGIELIVPNPAGGRGVYILPWTGVCEMCSPTLHDRRLNELVTPLPHVTPGAIRDAARSVAAEGLAGRPAQHAANEAGRTGDQQRLLTKFMLLLNLLRHVDPAGSYTVPLDDAGRAELEARAKPLIAGFAERLAASAEAVAADLSQLAELFEGVGVGELAAQARIPRALLDIRQLRTEVLDWSTGRAEDDAVPGAMIAAVADLTITCAETTLADARALAGNVMDLLPRWRIAPQPISQIVARPDWLLDGWSRIGALWQAATSDTDRIHAVAEMVPLLPVLPKEAAGWLELPDSAEAVANLRRLVQMKMDWRTGASVQDIVARNERLRAVET